MEDANTGLESAMKMRLLLLLIVLLVHGTATARPTLKYSYAELSVLDDGGNGNDEIRLGGSYDIGNDWMIVGGLSTLTGNNNDSTVYDVGVGHVWNYERDFDIVATFRFINETGGNGGGDNGYGFSAGARRLLAPQLEIRGTINHTSLNGTDTFFELGGDYFFDDQFSVGVTLKFAGDSDTFTIGARWFFK